MSHIISLTNHSKYCFISLILILALFSPAHAQTIEEPYTTSQKWGFGFAASFGISSLGFIMSGIMLLILRSKRLTKIQLKLIIAVLIAFAVGALFGDAIVHITPEVFGAHDHGEEATEGAATEGAEHADEEDHDHEPEADAHEEVEESADHSEEEHAHAEESEPIPAITSLLILVGFGTFVLIEKLFEWIGIAHSHGFGEDDHHHHHDHETKYQDNENPKEQVKKDTEGLHKEHEELKALPVQETQHNHEEVEVKVTAEQGTITMKHLETAKSTDGLKSPTTPKSLEMTKVNSQVPLKGNHENKEKKEAGIDLNENKSSSCFKTFFSLKGRKSSGCMILMADFLHNIMDGLAIGVAFSSGKKDLAVSTFVAILAHEIPQEIGDMGILLESKFPVIQALCCNGIINFSAIIGTLIGLAIGSINEAANAYVLAFVAGNFLYISLVSMLPMVMKEAQGKKSIWLLGAMIIGFGVNFALLAAED